MSSRPALLALGLALVAAAGPASAADTGQFMFTTAEPLPVAAGGTVFFRALAVNSGNTTWEADKTYLIIEIHDKDRKYIASTDRFRPAAAVTPGGNLQADFRFDVPVLYSGEYSFRVFVVHNDQRVAQSDFRSFTVTPQVLAPPPPRPPVPITVGGSAVVSYRNDTGPNAWQGDTSVNLSGTLGSAPYEFSANTIHDQNDSVDFRTVLFNYHGAYADLGAGDVSPSFSPLSVSGAGVRGGLVKSREIGLGPAKWVIEAVGARTAEPGEGTATTNGTFRRMMYGTQSAFRLPGNLTLRGNYLQVDDLQGSIDTPGPSLTPVRNRGAGGGLAWAPAEGLTVEGDWQHSSFEADKTSTAAATTDSAWRASAGYARPRWALTGSVSRNGADFVNLAAPGVAKDRFTHEGSLMLRPWEWMTLNNNFSQFRDNLEDDPAKTTSRQRSLGTNAALSFPTQTRLTLGYTLNRAFGSPRSTQDNKTAAASAGLNQSWDGGSIDLSYQRSVFSDKTGAASNLLTNAVNASWNWELSKHLSTTFGGTQTDTYDQKDGSRSRSRTLSGSFNGTLAPDRLSLRGSGSVTDASDNDAVSPSETMNTNLNLELTWNATKALGLTLGGFQTDSHDSITPANDQTVKGATVRVAYRF
jgi:hypothetical protein